MCRAGASAGIPSVLAQPRAAARGSRRAHRNETRDIRRGRDGGIGGDACVAAVNAIAVQQTARDARDVVSLYGYVPVPRGGPCNGVGLAGCAAGGTPAGSKADRLRGGVCGRNSGAGNETGTRALNPCFPITFFAAVSSEGLNYSLVLRPRQQNSSNNFHQRPRTAISSPDNRRRIHGYQRPAPATPLDTQVSLRQEWHQHRTLRPRLV